LREKGNFREKKQRKDYQNRDKDHLLTSPLSKYDIADILHFRERRREKQILLPEYRWDGRISISQTNFNQCLFLHTLLGGTK